MRIVTYYGEKVPIPVGWYKLRRGTKIKTGDKIWWYDLRFIPTVLPGRKVVNGLYIRKRAL